MTSIRARPVAALLVLLSVPGCGVGTEYDPWWDPGETQVAPLVPGVSGLVWSDGTFETAGAVIVGDDEGGRSVRGVYGFDLSALPAGAEVLEAVFITEQVGVTTTPYDHLGLLFADHVDLGLELDAADHAGGTIISGFGTLCHSPVLGIQSLDVTAIVAGDLLAGRPRTDLRLRFSTDTDADGQIDDCQLTSATGTEYLPRLEITYWAP